MVCNPNWKSRRARGIDAAKIKAANQNCFPWGAVLKVVCRRRTS
jgi:hypothetical protein